MNDQPANSASPETVGGYSALTCYEWGCLETGKRWGFGVIKNGMMASPVADVMRMKTGYWRWRISDEMQLCSVAPSRRLAMEAVEEHIFIMKGDVNE